MRSFFEGIQSVFVDFLFAPLDLLRHTEAHTGYWGWWIANVISWIAILVCFKYTIYWCKELKKHQDNNEENQDTTAHSFLK